ncbi:MAG: hypothetical protein HY567_01340 [Candidatus Kerfeldbacteria bacterium]|nr:hypothetical protein [Candidatus Kerfeldbacteria bacterium]
MTTHHDQTKVGDILRGYAYVIFLAMLLAVSFLLHPHRTKEFVKTIDLE